MPKRVSLNILNPLKIANITVIQTRVNKNSCFSEKGILRIAAIESLNRKTAKTMSRVYPRKNRSPQLITEFTEKLSFLALYSAMYFANEPVIPKSRKLRYIVTTNIKDQMANL
jgi:hypothetical protein